MRAAAASFEPAATSALASLINQFPDVPAGEVETVLVAVRGDARSAAALLASIQSSAEAAGAMARASIAPRAPPPAAGAFPALPGARPPPPRARPVPPPPPPADEFPALGASAPSSRRKQSIQPPTAFAAAVARGGGDADAAAAAAAAASRARAAPPLVAGRPRPMPADDAGERVATGGAVGAAYAALRSEASSLSRARNVCFEQATQAYLAGDKRLAKELGARGRALAEQMFAAHAAAAGATLDARGGGGDTLDLHGLHVAEAVAAVRAAVAARRAARAGGRGGSESSHLRIVTGVGAHSAAGARLPAAVEAVLEEEGLRWAGGRGGGRGTYLVGV